MDDKILTFIQDIYEATKTGIAKKEFSLSSIIKTHKLGWAYSKAVYSSGIIDIRKMKDANNKQLTYCIWKNDKELPNLQMASHIHALAKMSSKSHSQSYKTKKVEKVLIFLKNIYADTNKGKVSLLESELDIIKRLGKFSLDKEFADVIRNQFMLKKTIFVNNSLTIAYEWKYGAPDEILAEDIFSVFKTNKYGKNKNLKTDFLAKPKKKIKISDW